MSRLLLLHTSPIVMEDMERAFHRGSVTIQHHLDEDILPRLVNRGSLDGPRDPDFDGLVADLVGRHNPDLVQLTCTSLSLLASGHGGVPHSGRTTPVRAIDHALRRRLNAGAWKRPVVVTTVGTTRPVTERHLGGGPTAVRFLYVPKAFDARAEGDTERHNDALEEAARPVQHDHDVLLLPQASMYVARNHLSDALEIPVVHSADEAALLDTITSPNKESTK